MSRSHHIFVVLLFAVIFAFVASCANEQVVLLRREAEQSYEQGKKEEALERYQRALGLEPKNKELQERIDRLKREISDDLFVTARKRLREHKLHAASDALGKAARYSPEKYEGHPLQRRLRGLIAERDKLKHDATALAGKNEWMSAINTLKEAQGIDAGDVEIPKMVESFTERAFSFCLQEAKKAEAHLNWEKAVAFYEDAHALHSEDEQICKKLQNAKEKRKAVCLYHETLRLYASGDLDSAAERYLAAIDITSEIPGLEDFKSRFTSEYVKKRYPDAIKAVRSGEWKLAFTLFDILHRLDPRYKDVSRYFERSRERYLGTLYQRLLSFYDLKRWSDVVDTARRLREIQPNFLDTSEYIVRALQGPAYDFYTQGLAYERGGSEGVALLCYRSAQRLFPFFTFLEDCIQAAQAKIGRRVRFVLAVSEQEEEDNVKDLDRFLIEHTYSYLHSLCAKDSRFVIRQTHPYPDVSGKKEEDGLSGEGNRLRHSQIEDAVSGLLVFHLEDVQVNRYYHSKKAVKKYTKTELVPNPDWVRLLEYKKSLEKQLYTGTGHQGKDIRKRIKKIDGQMEKIAPTIPDIVHKEYEYLIKTHGLRFQCTMEAIVYDPTFSYALFSKTYKEPEKNTIEDEEVDPYPEAGIHADPLELPPERDFIKSMLRTLLEESVFSDLKGFLLHRGENFYREAEEYSKYDWEKAAEAYSNMLAFYRKSSEKTRNEYAESIKKAQQFLDGFIGNSVLLKGQD